jgi:hypothetical protein
MPVCAPVCPPMPVCAPVCHPKPVCAPVCHPKPVCAPICHPKPVCAPICMPKPVCEPVCMPEPQPCECGSSECQGSCGSLFAILKSAIYLMFATLIFRRIHIHKVLSSYLVGLVILVLLSVMASVLFFLSVYLKNSSMLATVGITAILMLFLYMFLLFLVFAIIIFLGPWFILKLRCFAKIFAISAASLVFLPILALVNGYFPNYTIYILILFAAIVGYYEALTYYHLRAARCCKKLLLFCMFMFVVYGLLSMLLVQFLTYLAANNYVISFSFSFCN